MPKLNRAQRRSYGKRHPEYGNRTQEEAIKALLQNGITTQDLEREFQSGYAAGEQEGLHFAYAVACLALHEQFGFGTDRCFRFIQALDKGVLEHLSSRDATDIVRRDLGLQFHFDDPIKGIEKIQKG